MIDTQYCKSCTEVLEILKYISTDEYSKIPADIINVLENDKDKEYEFKYDINKTLDEQNVSKQTKVIIAIFFRDYWATDIQREKIINIQKKQREKLDNEKREKYNPDKIFAHNIQKHNYSEINSLTKVKKENSIIQKVIFKIKSFFKIF